MDKTELSVLHKTSPSAALKVLGTCWDSGDILSVRSISGDSGVHGTNNSPSRQTSLKTVDLVLH